VIHTLERPSTDPSVGLPGAGSAHQRVTVAPRLRSFLLAPLLSAALVLWAAEVCPAQAEPGWRFPVDGVPDVLRGFEAPPFPWMPGHRGVDLALPAYGSVLSATAGRVTFAGPIAGQGVVVVAHGGLRSTYEPLAADVHVGDHVDAGELLGRLEPAMAHCGRTCLHWGVLRGHTYLDPLSLIDRGPPVLLPIGPPATRLVAPAPRTFSAAPGPTSWQFPALAAWSTLTRVPCAVCLGPAP
jgi:murein DD-endopeptidase MepM/ murein hydrolase activator NlpD